MCSCYVGCISAQIRSGEIGPFQCIKLDVIFTPTCPGETKLDFFIKFSDKNIKPVRYFGNIPQS